MPLYVQIFSYTLHSKGFDFLGLSVDMLSKKRATY